jgi:hypothetical protein
MMVEFLVLHEINENSYKVLELGYERLGFVNKICMFYALNSLLSMLISTGLEKPRIES